jgi:hypothetical protein
MVDCLGLGSVLRSGWLVDEVQFFFALGEGASLVSVVTHPMIIRL